MHFPSLEQLRAMPTTHFKGLNVTNKIEEELLQKVVNERLAKTPIVKPIYTGDVPFAIKSKEEEEKWQKILDDRRAAATVQPVAVSEETELVTKVEELKAEKEALQKSTKFCEFCDAVGPISHKKSCSRTR